MEKLNIFQKFIYSITNIKSYIVFLREKTAKGVLYILLLSVIFGGIKGYDVSRDVKIYFDNARTYLEENKDNFKLENGKLTIGTRPILKEEQNTLLFIDTSYDYDQYDQNKLAQLNLEKYMTSTLIFRDRVVVNNNGKQTVQKFSELGFNLDVNMIINILSATTLVMIILTIFTIIQVFIGNILWAVVLALAGLSAAYWLKVKIRFKGLYRISLYTLTTSIILDTILFLTRVVIPFFDIIYIAIAFVYLILALKHIKEEVSEEELFIIG
ncbi:DUF1189 domain-containing protein [Clostridium sp. 'White wine YQ']|uniref:DUF1189 domain-containing protein n=1 Tax=Clostridium sp. 'White wine YQ' TaxID=3027474 RepID=UPI0023657A8C|nr:DUF1189 domain-containing protein [Clostridium sp. 'White wine YQ']MDD7796029.1 DUF1189 domain-containing protein [Clostridium sp. 'White wine YQ']